MSKICILDHDENWSKLFKIEFIYIKQILGCNYVNIEHIGSTAVPGLMAKPIIDILVIVRNLKTAIDVLIIAGYSYRGEYNIPMRAYFNKIAHKTIHIHMYEHDHPEITLNLLFRDYLRQHRQVSQEYAQLKVKLLKDADSSTKIGLFSQYTLGKHDFICRILDKAGFRRLRITKATHYNELAAVAEFNQPNVLHNDLCDVESVQYLILYRGVHIIGYCHTDFYRFHMARIMDMVLNSANNADTEYFTCVINKWLSFHNYQVM